MSWFEVEYLLKINIDGLTDMVALFTSIQFGVFAVIYFLRDIGDRLMRHTVMFLYSLTWGFSFGRVMMDIIVINNYSVILSETLKRENNSELTFGAATSYAFMAVLIIVFLSLWAATFYFLYFHKFETAPETQKPEMKDR